jgi:hypothetical protein
MKRMVGGLLVVGAVFGVTYFFPNAWLLIVAAAVVLWLAYTIGGIFVEDSDDL